MATLVTLKRVDKWHTEDYPVEPANITDVVESNQPGRALVIVSGRPVLVDHTVDEANQLIEAARNSDDHFTSNQF